MSAQREPGRPAVCLRLASSVSHVVTCDNVYAVAEFGTLGDACEFAEAQSKKFKRSVFRVFRLRDGVCFITYTQMKTTGSDA